MADHETFWVDLLGKLGPPVCAATWTGCLLARRFELEHALLTAFGIGMIAVSHWYSQHRGE